VHDPDEQTTRRRVEEQQLIDMALVGAVVVGVVLRFWGLGSTPLSPDESYSAVATRLPLGDMLTFLRQTDPHPPLSYLILWPIARLGSSEGALRLASVVFSCAALAVMALWQRRRAIEGLVATAIFAVLPFQLIFARQVRMYGLLVLCGVVIAFAADRWLATSQRRWIFVAVGAGGVAAFSHAVGVVALGGVFLVAGLRRDREAWVLRGSSVAMVVLWWVTWGAQARRWSGVSLYSTISPAQVSITLNELIAPVPANRLLVLSWLAAGGVVLLVRRDRTTWVWLACGAAPVVAIAGLSLREALFIPKSMAVMSWVVPLALAAVIGAVARRLKAGAVALAVVAALVLLPLVPDALSWNERSASTVALLRSEVQPGDAVAGQPATATLIEWYAKDRFGMVAAPNLVALPDANVYLQADQPWNGRLWVFRAAFADDDTSAAWTRCADDRVVDEIWTVRCVEPPPT
jgi:hypothetical protein